LKVIKIYAIKMVYSLLIANYGDLYSCLGPVLE
jgi:hypothetical protein